MNDLDIDWDEDLPADSEDEYQALVRALRRHQGFGLLFVQCTPAEGQRIVQRVEKELPQKKIATLTFTKDIPDGNLYREVKAFLAEREGTDVLFIQGLEHSLYAYEDTKRLLGWAEHEVLSYSWKGVPPVMVNLNQQRENFRDNLNTCLVFFVSPFVKKYLIRRAPDFFDWRSGVFELPVAQEELQTRSVQAYGDYNEYLTWTPAARTQKLAELHDLIAEPNQTPDQKAALFLEQGNVFTANQDYEEAIAAYDQALAIKPDKYEALNNKGNALGNLGRYEEAIAAYDQALFIKPDDHEVLYSKGIALRNLGRYEEAIAAYDHALAIKPDKYEALDNKGYALTLLKRFEEAEACFNQAITINPDHANAWYNKGVLYGLQGKVESAIDALKQAITLDPKYREMAKTDTDFDPIRHDPRFQTLLNSAEAN